MLTTECFSDWETALRVTDMARKAGNYDEYHLEWLKDPENAAAFINAVIEDSDREAFLLALKDVAQAQGGTTATGGMKCR